MGLERPSTGDRPSVFHAFLTAVQFLLISPAFIRRSFTPQELGAAVGFYPVAGLILGAILAGSHYLMALFLPGLVCAAVTLSLWVVLTGALHLDGFLDTCDGLLGGFTPEQRMLIMRDERIGAYALGGGALLLLTKFSALASIQAITPALLLAPVLGRWGMAVALVVFPYARPQGLGRDVKDNASTSQAVLATVFVLIISAVLSFWKPVLPILISIAAAVLIAWLAARFTLRRIPGLTGDIYGAINELIEVFVLILWTIAWR
jgi:adenosylcobinamide-GDP ribazoletransferase